MNKIKILNFKLAIVILLFFNIWFNPYEIIQNVISATSFILMIGIFIYEWKHTDRVDKKK